MPLTIAKILRIFQNSGNSDNSKYIEKTELKTQFDQYVKNNSQFILQNIVDQYQKQQASNNNEKIENAIWLMEKEIFNPQLPQLTLNAVNDNQHLPKILILFSDFDLIKPIFQAIDQNEFKSKAHLFFRQIITQSQYSAIIASHAYAVSQLYPDQFLKFYIEIAGLERQQINHETIKEILQKHQFDLEKIENLAKQKNVQELLKSNNALANKLNIDQLPAFILENGQIFFGQIGFDILKNLK
jgi:hypothetical protein